MENDIKDRFENEVIVIKGYVDYIENNFYSRSCEVLRTQGYEDLELLKKYVFFSDDTEERNKNRDILSKLSEIIKRKIYELKGILEHKERIRLPQISKVILENDLQESLCSYVESTVYDCVYNPNNLSYSELVKTLTAVKLKEEVDITEEADDEKYYDMLTIKDYESILEYMKCKLFNDEIDERESELYEYQELHTLYSIFDDYAPINIYRQSFILLLTAFDAVVFDLAKNIFTSKFFEVSPYINYDKKFSLAEISKYDNFEEFSSQTIETIISGKYIADLLEILYKYKNDIFNIDEKDCYSEILEIVQRRNLHVHKKGIIDDKYFSKGNGSELGIQKGEYAVINDQYFNKTVALLRRFIQNLSEL